MICLLNLCLIGFVREHIQPDSFLTQCAKELRHYPPGVRDLIVAKGNAPASVRDSHQLHPLVHTTSGLRFEIREVYIACAKGDDDHIWGLDGPQSYPVDLGEWQLRVFMFWQENFQKGIAKISESLGRRTCFRLSGSGGYDDPRTLMSNVLQHFERDSRSPRDGFSDPVVSNVEAAVDQNRVEPFRSGIRGGGSSLTEGYTYHYSPGLAPTTTSLIQPVVGVATQGSESEVQNPVNSALNQSDDGASRPAAS